MKATVEVESRDEAEQIRAGLAEPEARALVKVMGALAPLPTKTRKQRVVKFVADLLAELDTNGGGA